MNDLKAFFELVFPQKKLSPWERLVLLSLFASNDFRCGERFIVKLGRVASLAGASETSIREYLRALAEKGVIMIEGYGRTGYEVTLVPPLSVDGINENLPTEPEELDIETADYFNDRRLIAALLARQDGKCFYSLLPIDEKSCELDHLIPQGRGGGNSYRNIVCCTFEMNKRKGDKSAEDFLRSLFRSSFLSKQELEKQLSLLNDVRSGKLKPA